MAGKEGRSAACPSLQGLESSERSLLISHLLYPGQYRPCINLQGFPSLNSNSSRFPALPLGYCSAAYGAALLCAVSLGISLNTSFLPPLS